MTFVRRFSFLALLLVAGAGFAGCNKSPVINFPPPAPPRLFVANLTTNSVTAFTQPFGPASTPSMTLTAPFTASPFGVAADASGNVWVSVQSLGEVLEFLKPVSASSTAATTIGPINGGGQATWVTFDAAGNLWVADQILFQIYEFTPPFSSGPQTPAFTITASTPAFVNPEKISFDLAGDMIVPQFNAAAVYVFRPPFSATPTADAVIATCAQPLQTQMNSADWLFVSCVSDGTLRVFKPPFATGIVQAFQIAPPAGGLSASGMQFDASGNLYVAYDGNSTIGVFAPPFSGTSVALFTFPTGGTFPGGLAFAP